MNWGLEEALDAKSLDPIQSDRQQAKEQMKGKIKDKLLCDSKYALADGSAAWQKCCQFLTLAWLSYSTQSLAEMRGVLGEMDDFMTDVGPEIELILSHMKGLKYLANAMWAHLAFKENNEAEVRDNLKFTKPIGDLDETDRAAVLALKCCVIMEFGPTGAYYCTSTARVVFVLIFSFSSCRPREGAGGDQRSFKIKREGSSMAFLEGEGMLISFCDLSLLILNLYSFAVPVPGEKIARFPRCASGRRAVSSQESSIAEGRVGSPLRFLRSIGSRICTLLELPRRYSQCPFRRVRRIVEVRTFHR